jgi:hypothetical protein
LSYTFSLRLLTIFSARLTGGREAGSRVSVLLAASHAKAVARDHVQHLLLLTLAVLLQLGVHIVQHVHVALILHLRVKILHLLLLIEPLFCAYAVDASTSRAAVIIRYFTFILHLVCLVVPAAAG